MSIRTTKNKLYASRYNPYDSFSSIFDDDNPEKCGNLRTIQSKIFLLSSKQTSHKPNFTHQSENPKEKKNNPVSLFLSIVFPFLQCKLHYCFCLMNFWILK